MQKSGQALLLMLLVLGLYSLTGCGGGASSTLGSSTNLPGNSADGVSNGGFKAIRYNDRGYPDSALNSTLDLQISADAGTTTVKVAIADQDPMLGACVDLFYDPAQVSPIKTEFAGLVSDPLELASSQRIGVVSVGQAATDGASMHSGDFAIITFANSPLRFASAAGDAHQAPVNTDYEPAQPGAPNVPTGFEVTKADIDATPAEYKFYSFFAIGDGNADGATTLGDLTAMVFNGYFGPANAVSAADWGSVPTDYNGDGETGVADLTALGQHLNEATTSIDVLIKDNDGNDFTGAETVAATHTWASGNTPARPPAAATLSIDSLMKHWEGTVDLATAQAADGNGDGAVLLSAVAKGTGAASPPFTDPGSQVLYPVGVAGVTVTGVNVTIDAAADQVFTGAGGDATLQASEAVTINITGIAGTFDPGGGNPVENFDGGPSATLPQADYDTALANVQNAATWTITTAGDSTADKYRTTVPVLNLSATTGTGITAGVTPDADNPDSTTATTPEGTLSLHVPAAGSNLPLAIDYDFGIDVTDDPAAPIADAMSSDQPAVGSFQGLNPAGSTIITATYAPGTATLPADPADLSVWLSPTYAAGEAFDGTAAIALTYTPNPVALPGEFTIAVAPGPPIKATISANVPASVLPGVIYGFQVSFDNAGTATTSSVNYPDNAFFTVGAPPAAVTFTTLPSGTIGGNNDALVIMYPEPQLRRDPRAEFTIGSTLSVADAAGFADTVKDGTPFTLSAVDDGGGNFTYFPQVVLVEGTDAAAITSTTQGEVAPVVYRTPGAVVLDISAQTFGGASDVNYAFKVFGGAAAQANWSNLGTGTFIYSPTAIAPGGPAGVDFGVNVFDDLDRGDLALANADFTLKSVNGSSINTPESDVLYIELANYGFYEFVTADPFDYDLAAMSAKNTRLRVTPDGGGTSMDVNLVPCAANLGVNGNTLVMYEFTNESFSNIGTPGWPGILSPGSQYDLTLVDPASPVSDFTFTSQLIVTGANPN